VKKFQIERFLVILSLLIALVFIHFIFAVATDEGTLEPSIISDTFAHLFAIVRFPAHILFCNFIAKIREFITSADWV
jgi:uncharacterized membrane protein (DUF485 family)